ncbi:MAG: LamG-like jellyroll fold domain-containing protein, partial [Planctomycetota bacterium]
MVIFLAGSVAVQACPIGDLSGDCNVGLEDLQIFAGQWLDGPGSCSDEDLTAHWRFDDDVKDSSENGYDGTIVGAPSYADGRIGKALDFDGLNDHVEVPGLTNPVNMTYALWVKANSLSGNYNTLLEFGNDDPWFGIRYSGKIEFYNCVTSSYPITIGQWHHIAVTSDGAQSIIYIDGAACGTGPPNTQSGTGLGIGYHDGDAHFDGLIDDVHIYNRALSEEEVRALAAGKTNVDPNCANLDDVNGVDMVDFAMLAANWDQEGKFVVIINEIHYDPDVKTEQVEFVELYNAGDKGVDLSGWYFSKGFTFTFPPGTTLAPDYYLVVAGSSNPFDANSPSDADFVAKFGFPLAGVFIGKLSNEGENVELRDANGVEIDQVD